MVIDGGKKNWVAPSSKPVSGVQVIKETDGIRYHINLSLNVGKTIS